VAGAWKKDRGQVRNEQWLAIQRRHQWLKDQLDERARQCWAGAEALVYGRGGLTVVGEACGMSQNTVRAGMREVQQAAARASAGGVPPCQCEAGDL